MPDTPTQHDPTEPAPFNGWTALGGGDEWWVMDNYGLTIATNLTEPQARLIAAAPDLLEAANAAIAYDAAIRSCGNSPDKMSSYCTAQGDTLDNLYSDWISRAQSAIAKAPT